MSEQFPMDMWEEVKKRISGKPSANRPQRSARAMGRSVSHESALGLELELKEVLLLG